MNRRIRLAIVVLGASALAAPAGAAPRLLDPMFQDHVVLQRDRGTAVWGSAAPGEQVIVAVAGQTARARADASGRWQTVLPQLPAGGPHTLTVESSSGARQIVRDVLVGDVYLCSGQSNMEWPVSRTLNPLAEISQSANDRIRLLTIAHADSPAPRDQFATPVAWTAAGPETVGDFSGACYYFARELQKSHDVPVGLIDASWGGSNVEAWISARALTGAGGFDEQLALLALYSQDSRAAVERLGRAWESWWRSKHADGAGDDPWRSTGGAGWTAVPAGMGDWKSWGVEALAQHNGMVWFRRTVTLTPEQAARGASLALGAIDEVDQTWVNGRPVGNTFGWGARRTYDLPAGTLRAGENLIVVNVLSTWGSGGMLGPADALELRLAGGTRVPLAGSWEYKQSATGLGAPPRAPWHAIGGLTTIYNGMIAPLGPFGIRGVLWYQGESNTGNAAEYEKLLQALMAGWRGQFGAETPFLVVQLPNFGRLPTAPVESGWASLRDAQRRAVRQDSRAALVVTIDVGDREELHPPNKQAVGRRLARAARHVIYGEPIAPSGPVAMTAVRDAGRIVVTFGAVTGRLLAVSGSDPNAFELCGPAPGSCRFVRGTLDGPRVVLDAPDAASATRVRYCWGEAPVCTLYDDSELPAGPFELQIAPGSD